MGHLDYSRATGRRLPELDEVVPARMPNQKYQGRSWGWAGHGRFVPRIEPNWGRANPGLGWRRYTGPGKSLKSYRKV